MSYRLIVKPSAEKDLDRLPRSAQGRIVLKLSQIEANPRTLGSVRQSGTQATYRLRAGDYRFSTTWMMSDRSSM